MHRKFLLAIPFTKTFEQTLFRLKVLSIWRLQYFLLLLKAGTEKRMELTKNSTGCFTE